MNEVGVLCTLYSTTERLLQKWGDDVGRYLLYTSMSGVRVKALTDLKAIVHVTTDYDNSE